MYNNINCHCLPYLLSKNNIIRPELALRLKKAVGFRNIAVHEYDKIN